MKEDEEKHELSLLTKILMVVVFFSSIILESLLATAILLSLFLLFVLCDYKLQETRKRGKRT
jgi:type II secretory pathway component PulF